MGRVGGGFVAGDPRFTPPHTHPTNPLPTRGTDVAGDQLARGRRPQGVREFNGQGHGREGGGGAQGVDAAT